MIGLLIVAHAPLAGALLKCLHHIYSAEVSFFAQSAALDISPQGDFDQSIAQAQRLCASLDTGQGVLVLTDLFGATPANIATCLNEPGRVEVLTGMNLPMLLRALTYRAIVPLDSLIEKALAGSHAGVTHISLITLQNQNPPITEVKDADSRMHHQQ